ncbi:MAG: hypothetical protein ACLFVE_08850 [Chitinispirillaceae bacterium]
MGFIRKLPWLFFPLLFYVVSVIISMIMFAAGSVGLHDGNFPALLCLPLFFGVDLLGAAPISAFVILGLLAGTVAGFFFRGTRVFSALMVIFWGLVPLVFAFTCSNYRFMYP